MIRITSILGVFEDDFLPCKCKRAPLAKDIRVINKRLVTLDRQMIRFQKLKVRLLEEKKRLEESPTTTHQSSPPISQ